MTQLDTIREKLAEAASEPLNCNAKDLLDIVCDDIVPWLTRHPDDSNAPKPPPSSLERHVLGCVMRELLREPCQHRLVHRRMEGVKSALDLLAPDRLRRLQTAWGTARAA